MRVEVIMPRMGQGMEEGTILRWLIPIGGVVKRGDPLIEIESDKATVEIEAFANGRLAEIVVREGDVAPIGTVLAYIEAVERVPSAPDPAPPDLAILEEEVPQKELVSPPVNGERRGASISPVARRVAQEHGLDPDALTGTGKSGRITKDDVHSAVSAQAVPTAEGTTRLDVSPVARRLAREHDLDLRLIVGSAPDGRIIKRDIVSALATAPNDAPRVMQPSAQPVNRLPLSRLRRIAAKRMTESKQQIPHFYLTLDVQMDRALLLRESLTQRGKRVSINDLVLKGVSLALAEHPALNATYAGDDLILNPAINLAVAVAVGEKGHPEGLITPVIHGCQALTLVQIAGRASEIASLARNGKLTPDDLSGATFTVSNLGMFGIRHFQAIINPSQVAIMAVGSLQKWAIFDDQDRATPAHMMTVTLSADHRATDGAQAARFLATFKAVIEDAFVLAE